MSSPPAPTFDVLEHYGSPQALDSITSVAAPLLAAGGLALIGTVVQASERVRWSGVALVVLTAAVVALVLSVQLGAWARQSAVTPAQIAEWWPMMAPERRWQRVRLHQWRAQARFRAWERRAGSAFRYGLWLLWVGVAFSLVPKTPLSPARAVAVGVASASAIAEVVWTLAGGLSVNPHAWQGRLPGFRRLAALLDPGATVIAAPPEVWSYDAGRDPYEPS